MDTFMGRLGTVGGDSVSVRVCSWNLGGRHIDEKDDLSALLAPPGKEPADIVVVGVQELVELSVGNIFLATEEEAEHSQHDFDKRVSKELTRLGHRYTKVGSVGMVGLYLLVYIRDNLHDKVEEVICDRVKTGIFHLAGNKGSVCLRFSLCGMTFCFMNVHLHHGVENQAARNHDIEDTLRAAFQGHCAGHHHRGLHLPGHNKQHCPCDGKKFTAPMHHVVVIFGDLNIRLDLPAHEPLPNGGPRTWLEYDQMRKGLLNVLDGYSEGEIDFPPTYKYQLGSDEYDHKRLPAWCDRVVYKAMPGVHVYICEYFSVQKLRHTSDHRPVVAVLEVETDDDELFLALRQARSGNGLFQSLSQMSFPLSPSADTRSSCCWPPIASAIFAATGLVAPIPVPLRRRRKRKVPTIGYGRGLDAMKLNLDLEEAPKLHSPGSAGGRPSGKDCAGIHRSGSKESGNHTIQEVVLRSASKDNIHVSPNTYGLRRCASKELQKNHKPLSRCASKEGLIHKLASKAFTKDFGHHDHDADRTEAVCPNNWP